MVTPPADDRTPDDGASQGRGPEERVVRLPAAEHAELKELLPWYVTGRLEPAEHAQVEAHLAGCRRCRADAAFQRRLGAEVASLPLEVEHGWDQMRRQIENETQGPLRRILRRLTGSGGWWVAGAALAAATMAIVVLPPAPGAEYRALSAPAAQPVGEVVVIFRPDATERQMREALKAAGARVVDGPTSTDAFVLDVPDGRRDAALASLRRSGAITLAEPLDGGAGR